MIGVLIFVQLQAILDLSLILKLPSFSSIHKLGTDLHISSNHQLRNEGLSIQGISVTPITGQFEETNTLFDVVNSSLSLSNVEILIEADFSIAHLLESSRITIQRSTLDFGREFTPFVADGGSVTLIDIVLSGRAPLPELMDSSTPDTHLIMSKCVAQDVIVGLSPIFGPSSYSVEVSLSVFANIDHAVPLLYSPRPHALHTSSILSLETYSTILASSTMVNVTDDVFGAITNAPILGKSFLFRDVLSEQQTVKCDVRSTNAESPQTMEVTTETDCKVEKTKFRNSKDINEVGVSGLLITAIADAKLTITSCSFEKLYSSGIGGFGVTTSHNNHFIQLIMEKCEFSQCAATHVISATLQESSVEMDEVFWDDCEGQSGIVFITGRSPKPFSSDGGIELRGCGFDHCRSVTNEHSNLACLWISYAGPVLLHQQTTFMSSKTASSSAIISAALVFIRETRFVRCESTAGRAGGCTVRGYQVSLENVLMQSCLSRSTPTSFLISLFYDVDLLKVLEIDERQKYEMRKSYIERAESVPYNTPDVVFAVPESLIVYGNLNATRFDEVFTTAERNTVAMTTTDIISSWYDPPFYDQTAIVSLQGDDPREDRWKRHAIKSEKKRASDTSTFWVIFGSIIAGIVFHTFLFFIVFCLARCCCGFRCHKCCQKCDCCDCGGDCYCCAYNDCNMCCNCVNCFIC
ncbi:hypothetical protein BLNAU_23240 [Blattamonas nauphoetae]|uniref:Glycoprotein n=1 Tax=Blattamonas nauphoetae TaxID=2049346 RepID=A0ABQ9WQT9_9EUKA|nr:hypothetical protein BLNAU_23240 [Blattamonas nauphoetae]